MRAARIIGLGCWLASMLLYSNVVTPFQRLGGTALFVGSFAPWSLGCAAVVALAVALASLRGLHLSRAALAVGGGVLYVGGALAFAALAYGGEAWAAGYATWDGGVPAGMTAALSACVGAGCVGTGLVWGRVFKACDIRHALADVAASALVSAALGALGACLPAGAFVWLFCAEALAAATLPAFAGMRGSACEAALTAEGLRLRPLSERLRSFADVAAPALTGLLAFAFVMGTMRSLIVDSYGIHLGVLVACACVLAGVVCASRRAGASVQGSLRGVIPVLAVLQLAAANVTSALWGGSAFDMVMIFLLYTLAALVTLGTLAAIAHAEEFPADLVFSVALLLFCLASILGLTCAEVMTPEQIKVSTTLVTTAYAFATVLLGGLRGRRPARVAAGDAGGETAGREAGTQGAGPGTPAPAKTAAPVPTLRERCDVLGERFHLTAREREILALLARGYESAQISEELYISQNTVRSHVHNLCRKTGAADREGLVRIVRG